MDRRKYLGIGLRTRKNILKGKHIRKLEDGGDVFEDYWTDVDSDSEQSSSTKSNSNLTEEPATFVIPTSSEQEFSKVTVTKIQNDEIIINKSSLLLKEVTEIPPSCLPKKSIMATKTKNSAQMEEILPHYDEIDLQIMQIMNNLNGTNELSQNHEKGLNDSTSNSNSKPISKECTSKNEKECIDESIDENGEEYDLELLAKKLGKVASSNKISPKKKANILISYGDGDNEKNPLNAEDVLENLHTSDPDDDFSIQKEKNMASKKKKRAVDITDDSKMNSLNATDIIENLPTSDADNGFSTEGALENLHTFDADDFSVQKQKSKIASKKKKRIHEESNDSNENNSLNAEDVLEKLHTSDTDDNFSIQKEKCKMASKKKKVVNEKSDDNEKNPLNAEDVLENLHTSDPDDDFSIQKEKSEMASKKKKRAVKITVDSKINSVNATNVLKNFTSNANNNFSTGCALENLHTYDSDNFSVQKQKRKIGSKKKKRVHEESDSDSNENNSLNAEDVLENLHTSDTDKFSIQKEKGKMSSKKKKKVVNEKSDKINPLNAEDVLENLHSSAADTFSEEKKKSKMASKKKKKVNGNSDEDNEINPLNDLHTSDTDGNFSVQKGKSDDDNEINPLNDLHTSDTDDSFSSQKGKADNFSVRRGKSDDNEINPLDDLHTLDADNFSVQKKKSKMASKMKKKVVNEESDDNEINPLDVEDALENLHTSFTKNEPSRKRQKCNADSKKSKISKNKKRVVNEETDNTSENVCTSATKDDLSLREVQSAKPVRKSSRQRFPPLDRWRNERLLYRYEKGNFNLIGVDKGSKEDDASVKFLLKSRVKKEFPKPKKAKLVNAETNNMLSADILKRFSLIPWNLTNKQNEKLQPYLIKRMFETPETAFGFIQINVGKEKPRQYMPEDDVQLTVIRGEIELTLQNNCYKAKEKDMFVVPRGCAYSIKNIGKIGALLSFVVGKFDFLENQID